MCPEAARRTSALTELAAAVIDQARQVRHWIGSPED
jgi:hypothetical protein